MNRLPWALKCRLKWLGGIQTKSDLVVTLITVVLSPPLSLTQTMTNPDLPTSSNLNFSLSSSTAWFVKGLFLLSWSVQRLRGNDLSWGLWMIKWIHLEDLNYLKVRYCESLTCHAQLLKVTGSSSCSIWVVLGIITKDKGNVFLLKKKKKLNWERFFSLDDSSLLVVVAYNEKGQSGEGFHVDSSWTWVKGLGPEVYDQQLRCSATTGAWNILQLGLRSAPQQARGPHSIKIWTYRVCRRNIFKNWSHKHLKLNILQWKHLF